MTAYEIITKYIDEHISEEITSNDLSKATGYSKRHLYNIFKAHNDMSLMKYVRWRKVHFAANELLSGKKLYDIALDYGYETPTGFYKAFQNIFGCSPRNYRKDLLIMETNKNINIKIVGIGGCGKNILHELMSIKAEQLNFVAVNTDESSLTTTQVPTKIQVGTTVEEESTEEISNNLDGAEVVFIIAGLGGVAGTGNAPVISRIAKSKGAITFGIVTTPFSFEGQLRHQRTRIGIASLSEIVDRLIIIPNDRLKEIPERLSVNNAFMLVNEFVRDMLKNLISLDCAEDYLKRENIDSAVKSSTNFIANIIEVVK